MDNRREERVQKDVNFKLGTDFTIDSNACFLGQYVDMRRGWTNLQHRGLDLWHPFSVVAPLPLYSFQFLLILTMGLELYPTIKTRPPAGQFPKLAVFQQYLQQQVFMASFHIQTDKTHYRAGETIRGKVLVHVASNINNTEGVTLRFVGRQSLRWRQKRPIDAQTLVGSNTNLIPTERTDRNCNNQIYRTDELDISDCQTQDNGKDRLQPKIIKTADNSYFQLLYRDKRNEFTQASLKLFPPGKIVAGQYSFPFSVPTQHDWPGSSNHKRNNTASQLRYLLTITLQPYNPRYHFRQRKEIFITQAIDSIGYDRFLEEVSSFYCLKKGRTEYEVTLNKSSYLPGEEGEIMISIDNSECSADVEGVSLAFIHTMIQQKADDPATVVSELETKQISCLVKGGQSAKFASAIRQSFKIPDVPATSRGIYTSSELSIKVSLKHAATFYTNSVNILPIIIGSPERVCDCPSEFNKSWKPTEAQIATLQPNNLFKRVKTSALKGKG